MQQLCRQHGFHSKHLRLKQCYSVYYNYHIMSRLLFILLINGPHDIGRLIFLEGRQAWERNPR